MHQFNWVVFSSVNGVEFLLKRVAERGLDSRRFGTTKIAAIGPATGDRLKRYGLRADFVPETYRAESLAAGLATEAAGQSFLLVRASRGREVLSETLTAAGAHVTQVVAYQSLDVSQPRLATMQMLQSGKIDYALVTSSAIARSLSQLFGAALKQTKLVSISPITTATLTELNFPPYLEASTYDMSGLIEVLVKSCHDESARDINFGH
jgi:uroporphyrinogen III methyltransferase / synthase